MQSNQKIATDLIRAVGNDALLHADKISFAEYKQAQRMAGTKTISRKWVANEAKKLRRRDSEFKQSANSLPGSEPTHGKRKRADLSQKKSFVKASVIEPKRALAEDPARAEVQTRRYQAFIQKLVEDGVYPATGPLPCQIWNGDKMGIADDGSYNAVYARNVDEGERTLRMSGWIVFVILEEEKIRVSFFVIVLTQLESILHVGLRSFL